jgi:hypothetical protein
MDFKSNLAKRKRMLYHRAGPSEIRKSGGFPRMI